MSKHVVFKRGDCIHLRVGWESAPKVRDNAASSHWCRELSINKTYIVSGITDNGSVLIIGCHYFFNPNCFEGVYSNGERV